MIKNKHVSLSEVHTNGGAFCESSTPHEVVPIKTTRNTSVKHRGREEARVKGLATEVKPQNECISGPSFVFWFMYNCENFCLKSRR